MPDGSRPGDSMGVIVTDIVIIGAAGHGKVVADALISSPRNGIDYAVFGFVDDDVGKVGTKVCGRPVLGPPSMLDELSSARGGLAVIVAVDGNDSRRAIFERLDDGRFEFAKAIHRGAVISETAHLGRGVFVGAGAVVDVDAVVEDDVALGAACTIDRDAVVGAHSYVCPRAYVGGEAHVGKGAVIGAGALVMPNVNVGAGAIVTAGAVVGRDVPDGARAGGAPAAESQ